MKTLVSTLLILFCSTSNPSPALAGQGEPPTIHKCADVLEGIGSVCGQPKYKCARCMNECPHRTRDSKACDRGCPGVCSSSQSEVAAQKEEFEKACVDWAKRSIDYTRDFYSRVKIDGTNQQAIDRMNLDLESCKKLESKFNLDDRKLFEGPGGGGITFPDDCRLHPWKPACHPLPPPYK